MIIKLNGGGACVGVDDQQGSDLFLRIPCLPCVAIRSFGSLGTKGIFVRISSDAPFEYPLGKTKFFKGFCTGGDEICQAPPPLADFG